MECFFWRAYFSFVPQKRIEMVNLKAVTEQLGVLYRCDYPKSREKAIKIGIRKIYDALDHKVSKRQINKFINLFAVQKCSVSVPYKSIDIFAALTRLIDGNDKLRDYCKHQCDNCIDNQHSIYCREKLIYSFYECILAQQNQLNLRAKEEVLEPLMNFDVKCK